MPQIIEVPGQGKVEFPDGMNDAQIVAAIKANSQPEPSMLEKLGRQFGLTARAGVQGVTAIPNAIGDALGLHSSETMNGLLDKVLPSPQNSVERFSNAVAGGMVQPGGMAKVLPQLGQRIGTQIAAAGAGAGSSELARAAGAGPWGQMAAGLVGGAALPTSAAFMLAGGQGVARTAHSLVAPLTASGRQDLVARTLQGAANNPQTAIENIRTAPSYVPGVNPTLAEIANDSGLSALQKSLRNQNPAAFNNVEVANDSARQAYLKSQFGTPADLMAAQDARNAATGPLRDAAFANAKPVDTAPVVQAGTNALDAGAKYRGSGPMLQKFVSDIAEIKDPQVLYNGPRKAISDAIAGKVSQDSPLAQFTKTELISLRAGIDDLIEQSAPGFKNYLSTHADLSRQIDAKALGQELGQKSLNPLTERLSPAQFSRQVSSRADEVAKAGSSASDVITRINEDLKRSVGPLNATKTSGSDTLQNMVGNDMLQRALGHVPGGIATKLAGKVAGWIYQLPENQVRELLLQGVLDPKVGSSLLGRQIQRQPDLTGGLLRHLLPISYGGLLGTIAQQ